MILFKKENNSLNKRKGFSKVSLLIRFNIFKLNINRYIYIFEFHNFYIVEKRKSSFIIFEIMKYFCFYKR